MPRALVIEDDPDICELICEILHREGFEVSAAADGDAGIVSFLQNPANLVVSDIFMPGKDGINTIRELRSLGHPVKIIAVSGGGWRMKIDYLEAAKEFGANLVLRKPFSPQQLRDAIAEVFPR